MEISWRTFFSSAGISPESLEQYCMMFEVNKITSSTLVDLNKEFLLEMGITAVGDIIAILREARKVIQLMKPTGFKNSALQRVGSGASLSAGLSLKGTPASRTIAYYMKKSEESVAMSDPNPSPFSNTTGMATPPRGDTEDVRSRLSQMSKTAADLESQGGTVFNRLGGGGYVLSGDGESESEDEDSVQYAGVLRPQPAPKVKKPIELRTQLMVGREPIAAKTLTPSGSAKARLGDARDRVQRTVPGLVDETSPFSGQMTNFRITRPSSGGATSIFERAMSSTLTPTSSGLTVTRVNQAAGVMSAAAKKKAVPGKRKEGPDSDAGSDGELELELMRQRIIATKGDATAIPDQLIGRSKSGTVGSGAGTKPIDSAKAEKVSAGLMVKKAVLSSSAIQEMSVPSKGKQRLTESVASAQNPRKKLILSRKQVTVKPTLNESAPKISAAVKPVSKKIVLANAATKRVLPSSKDLSDDDEDYMSDSDVDEEAHDSKSVADALELDESYDEDEMFDDEDEYYDDAADDHDYENDDDSEEYEDEPDARTKEMLGFERFRSTQPSCSVLMGTPGSRIKGSHQPTASAAKIALRKQGNIVPSISPQLSESDAEEDEDRHQPKSKTTSTRHSAGATTARVKKGDPKRTSTKSKHSAGKNGPSIQTVSKSKPNPVTSQQQSQPQKSASKKSSARQNAPMSAATAKALLLKARQEREAAKMDLKKPKPSSELNSVSPVTKPPASKKRNAPAPHPSAQSKKKRTNAVEGSLPSASSEDDRPVERVVPQQQSFRSHPITFSSSESPSASAETSVTIRLGKKRESVTLTTHSEPSVTRRLGGVSKSTSSAMSHRLGRQCSDGSNFRSSSSSIPQRGLTATSVKTRLG